MVGKSVIHKRVKFSLISIVLLVAVLMISGCAQTAQDTGGTDSGSSGVLQPGAGLGPKAVYMNYKEEFDKAESYSEYAALVRKYGSSDAIEKIDKASVPMSMLNSAFEMMKSVAPTASDFASVDEQITGDTATLSITTKDGESSGTISMVKEDGVWKVQKDSWS